MLASLQREFASIVPLNEGKGWVSHSPELWSVIDRTAELFPSVAGHPK